MRERTDLITAQQEWNALVAAFGAMRAALGEDPSAALSRFGCDRHLVAAVAAAWQREHHGRGDR